MTTEDDGGMELRGACGAGSGRLLRSKVQKLMVGDAMRWPRCIAKLCLFSFFFVFYWLSSSSRNQFLVMWICGYLIIGLYVCLRNKASWKWRYRMFFSIQHLEEILYRNFVLNTIIFPCRTARRKTCCNSVLLSQQSLHPQGTDKICA